MSEIAKCVCGSEAEAVKVRCDLGVGHAVRCEECGWRCGPHEEKRFAIAAWSSVMRPRPKVREVKLAPDKGCYFHFDSRILGEVTNGDWRWYAQCGAVIHQGKDMHPVTYADCRAWLIDRLTKAGFDVVESEEK